MDRRDDAPQIDADVRPIHPTAPAVSPERDDEFVGARDALRATPNQHSFEDEDPGDDAARNYHGVDDGA